MNFSVNSIQWGTKEIVGIEIYNTLPSTNTFSKNRITAGCLHGTVIWALEQTAGKGRRGRRWFADHSSLTFSVLWKFPNYKSLGLLPLTVGLGVTKALGEITKEVKVKWPNDLWVGKRKLGGILVESVKYKKELWAIVGVGLNVTFSRTYPYFTWISLEEATGCVFSRFGILNLVLSGVEQGLLFTRDPRVDLNGEFRRHGNFLDKNIVVQQAGYSFLAVAKKVLADGRLLIESEYGLLAIMPDEISLRFFV